MSKRNRGIAQQVEQRSPKPRVPSSILGAPAKEKVLSDSDKTFFISLQKELSGTEDKISYARQFYNDVAMKYNNKIEMFPSNIVAGMFNFKTSAYFNATAEERENVKVKF